MTTAPNSLDSFNCRHTLEVDGESHVYFDLKQAERNGLEGVSRLPFSLKVLLENLLRHEDGASVTKAHIHGFSDWLKQQRSTQEIAFRPTRVLMQDFTGVPAVVDLAAMRDAMKSLGGDPALINPLVPVDLVIDHSVMVDYFGSGDAFARNITREYERNRERYEFLRWGGEAFDNFTVAPPDTGICHQINLEYLARTVWSQEIDGQKYACPDTLVGTDSHTTMINSLGVLGWGVGGIEAEAAMLGQPISMLIPEVVGVRLIGALAEGLTATDLVLRIVEMLRAHGVVGKFVEFFGDGLDHLSLEDQATIANMAPEYGATCGFFPIDEDTLSYLRATGRGAHTPLVEAYAKAQGLWREADSVPVFTDVLELDLEQIKPAISGPKRPQDRIELADASDKIDHILHDEFGKSDEQIDDDFEVILPSVSNSVPVSVAHGDVMIAAITSCTNTSNPSVMIAAGLLARKAREKGLHVKPWVKTSLAPGSQVVTDYLQKAGLMTDLEALGFNLVGYGCTTCIGNSGPLAPELSKAIADNDLIACSVLSGNRNFEGRISPDAKANFLASPPLVVAYALAGTMRIDMTTEMLGLGDDGQIVFLKDIWPGNKEVAELARASITPEMFSSRYGDIYKGDEHWRAIKSSGEQTYDWDENSTYVRNPPFFDKISLEAAPVRNIENARILALFGDSITTDHISPAGAIAPDSPAGRYLSAQNVPAREFNSYGARRGNHEVMMRGTFANIRIRNQISPGSEGGVTIHAPSGEQMSIYDAAMKYISEDTPLVVLAGREYGTGSSRDWAAKGTRLLGVRAVIAESFERIHRSNLIGMGVLPLTFADAETGWRAPTNGLKPLKGDEQISISGLDALSPGAILTATISYADGASGEIPLLCRIDTEDELSYYQNGGILPHVLRQLAKG